MRLRVRYAGLLHDLSVCPSPLYAQCLNSLFRQHGLRTSIPQARLPLHRCRLLLTHPPGFQGRPLSLIRRRNHQRNQNPHYENAKFLVEGSKEKALSIGRISGYEMICLGQTDYIADFEMWKIDQCPEMIESKTYAALLVCAVKRAFGKLQGSISHGSRWRYG